MLCSDNSSVNNDKEWVVVGRIGRPHGIKGGISIHSFTQPKENILSYPRWHVRLKGQWTPLKRLNVEEHTRFIVAQFDGYQAREEAAQLTNLDIAVKSCELPKLSAGEFYWHQLVGMTVVNTQGVVLGTVSEIMPTGSNDVLVVSGDKRTLIPYRYGVVVLEVCQDKHQIIVDWDDEYL